MGERNESFPTGLESFFLFVMLVGLEWVVGAALYDMNGYLGLPEQDIGGMVMLLANAVLFTALMHYKGLSYRSLFHSSPSSPAATLFVLTPLIALTIPGLVLSMSVLCALLVYVFPLSSWEIAMFDQMSSGSFGAIIAACILAPILEEMLFRGIILRSFLSQYSRWSAIVGSATLFGFAHMNLYQFVVALVLGIGLGWLYERSKSLLPCIVLHAAYNTTLTVIDLGSSKSLQDGTGGVSAGAWVAAFVLCAAGIYMLRRALLVPDERP